MLSLSHLALTSHLSFFLCSQFVFFIVALLIYCMLETQSLYSNAGEAGRLTASDQILLYICWRFYKTTSEL